jgi:hypothetical protein
VASRKKSPPTLNPHSYLHGIIRSNAGELYALKRDSFEALLAERGETLVSFAEKVFGEACFQGTAISKAELVVQLLKDALSPSSWRLIRDRLREHPFLTDRRHTEEYAFDVALGWLEEELVIGEFQSRLPKGISIERVGIDRAREFLSLNIRATADLAVRSAHRRLLIDIFVDHKSTWRRNGGMDLKQGKLGHFARGRLDYVLGLDLVARRFYLVDGAAVIGAPTFANAAMGGTETARIPLGKSMTFAGMAKRVGAELKSPRELQGEQCQDATVPRAGLTQRSQGTRLKNS